MNALLETPLRVCRVCGLEAYMEDDLKLFKKRTGYPYDRLTICKKCVRSGLKKSSTPYIRKCYVCGYEAHIIEELEKFTKHKNRPLGRSYICKKCDAEKAKESLYKTSKFIEVFKDRNKTETINCYFCGESIIKTKGQDKDALNIHSLDGNHNNWNEDNKVPTHRSCHSYFHSKTSNSAQHLEKWRNSVLGS